MKNLILQLTLAAVSCVAASSCAVTDQHASPDEADVFSKPVPEFPNSEYQSGAEGWVVIDYSVGRGGVVEYVHIRDSSGNSSFEDSAIAAVESWRFEPGNESELSVLFHFAHRGDENPFSEEFQSLHRQAHELIDEGKLDRASEVLAKAREKEHLSLPELAYSHLAEGRIAGLRGDRTRQLDLYRKAMMANGRWLAQENYMEALQVAVILELDQGDIASAVRDYDLLSATRKGRRLGADFEDLVEAARTQVEAARAQAGDDQSVMKPYIVADSVLTVLPGQPSRYSRTELHSYHPAPYAYQTSPRPKPRSSSRSKGPRSRKD